MDDSNATVINPKMDDEKKQKEVMSDPESSDSGDATMVNIENEEESTIAPAPEEVIDEDATVMEEEIQTHVKTLGKYQIERELGQGAMGIVFKGFDPFIERVVAIKTIRKDLLDQKEVSKVLARFKREAQASGRLTHPNIVAVYEYGEDGDTAFIAMEFVEGKELKEHFEGDERFHLKDIIEIMVQILSALAYAGKNGVTHRDIKPANIIINTNGDVKVTDFGIARIESSNLTQAGAVMGTPSYMSPEQIMGQRVDGRSDVFSAGVMFYEFLTGEKPFPGSSLTTIMHKILNVDPDQPSKINFQVPAPFDDVIQKVLAKKPDERYQTAEEFSDAIKQAYSKAITEGLIKVDGEPSRFGGSAQTSTIEAATAMMDTSMAKAQPQKNKGMIIGLAVVVIAIVIGGGIWTQMDSGVKKATTPTVSVDQPATSAGDTETQPAKELTEAVDFTSIPQGAAIFMNGEFKGVTPKSVELKHGIYEIKMSKHGYEDYEIEYELTSDAEKNISAELFKIE